MTVLVLSLVLAAAGCTGLILAGKGMWQGWAIGLAVQPVWAVFAIVTHGYGLLIACVMYGTVNGRNLLKWRAKVNAEPAPWQPISAACWRQSSFGEDFCGTHPFYDWPCPHAKAATA